MIFPCIKWRKKKKTKPSDVTSLRILPFEILTIYFLTRRKKTEREERHSFLIVWVLEAQVSILREEEWVVCFRGRGSGHSRRKQQQIPAPAQYNGDERASGENRVSKPYPTCPRLPNASINHPNIMVYDYQWYIYRTYNI